MINMAEKPKIVNLFLSDLSYWSFIYSKKPSKVWFLRVLSKIFQKNNTYVVKTCYVKKNIQDFISSSQRKKITVFSKVVPHVSNAQQNENCEKIKRSISSIQFYWFQSPQFLTNLYNYTIVNFHTKSGLWGSLTSKQPDKKSESKEEIMKHWGGPEAYNLIIFIKHDFEEILKRNESLIVFFSAHWCPHCSRLRKPFGTAALMAKKADLPVTFATFDVTTDPDVADEKGVIGVPTIKYYKKGKFIATYRGKRTADDLFQFAKNPPQPVTGTKTPDV